MLCNKAYDWVLSTGFFTNVERIADLHNDKCLTLVQWCLGPLLAKPADTPVGAEYGRILWKWRSRYCFWQSCGFLLKLLKMHKIKNLWEKVQALLLYAELEEVKWMWQKMRCIRNASVWIISGCMTKEDTGVDDSIGHKSKWRDVIYRRWRKASWHICGEHHIRNVFQITVSHTHRGCWQYLAGR